MRGLGDLIAWLLAPLEPLIRRFYGKKGCGCKKRQETLNRAFPNPFETGKPLDPTPSPKRAILTETQIFQKKSAQFARIGKEFKK